MVLRRCLSLTMAVTALLVSGCNLNKGSEFHPTPSNVTALKFGKEYSKGANFDIQITVDHIDRPHRVIGNINAYARSFFPWSSDPTADDVNIALKREANSQNADAIMDVDYRSEKTYSSDHGEMIATGVAIVYPVH